MKRIKQNYTSEIAELRNFLSQDGWQEIRRGKNLAFYAPPNHLNISEKFTIALPTEEGISGTDSFISQAVSSLEDIYGYRFLELKDSLATKAEFQGSAQFNVRFLGADTEDGNIPLSSMKNFLEQMSKSLYEGAKFKLDGSSNGPSSAVAEQFADECKFLQTLRGSFIARIEVPFGWLQQGDLFDRKTTSSHDVCSSLHSAIEFITSRILGSTEPFDSEAAISEAIELFNPELLESLAKMLVLPNVDRLEIAMEIGLQRRTSVTGYLHSDHKSRLNDYVQFIKRHFYGEGDVEIVGTIVELRSRDPQGNSNHIRISSEFHGDRIYVSATLTNDQYAIAVEAHRKKMQVQIRGAGIRLKTQLRLEKIVSFETV